ncbi:hypothetical protein [Streptomyces sp. Midd1]|uniref:hypothetical protein n=1 Tax=Streptomyces sp. Midd3 TaxID=3161191 RepID=UPI0034DAC9E8
MADGDKREHGMFGYATCLPDPRWDDNEFVQNMGHALVGLVPLRMSELRGTGWGELTALAVGAAKSITEKGDIFQFQAGQRAQTWRPSGVLSQLCTAYAVLALATPDEGITRFGFHACFWEHAGCPRDRDR